MPAYFDCGFSVREPAWHGLGNVLEDYPEDWDAARMAAGLMWEPRPEPVFVKRGDLYVEAPGHQAICRDDTGAVLAVPTDHYSLITHANMGEIIEAVMGADANVRFETAGSVREGRQVWALVRLDEPYTVPGDDSPTYPFLALLNAHDGSASCSLTYTSVRVVCWNTWSAADAEGARTGARHVFRHTGDVQERISEAKAGLANLRTEAAKAQALFSDLAQTPVSDDQVKTFTQLFLPSPADRGEFCSDRVAANVERARGTFGRLYSEAVTTESVRGTGYGLFMAATEYLDHVRAFRSRDSYVGRTILSPERLKGRALALIGDITGN